MRSRPLVNLGALLVAGCVGPGPAPDVNVVDIDLPERRDELADGGPKEPHGGEKPYALRVNRTLLYPVQYQRAETLAETLRPILVARFGPGTTVVPHPESNHLLITLPPPSVRDAPPR